MTNREGAPLLGPTLTRPQYLIFSPVSPAPTLSSLRLLISPSFTNWCSEYLMQSPHSTICRSPDSTPPGKTIVLPPSPPKSDEKPSPAVAAVVRLLQSHRNGTLRSGPWIKLRLLLAEHTKVWQLLKKTNGLGGYVEDKVRYGRALSRTP